jgi:hypothetical protein
MTLCINKYINFSIKNKMFFVFRLLGSSHITYVAKGLKKYLKNCVNNNLGYPVFNKYDYLCFILKNKLYFNLILCFIYLFIYLDLLTTTTTTRKIINPVDFLAKKVHFKNTLSKKSPFLMKMFTGSL